MHSHLAILPYDDVHVKGIIFASIPPTVTFPHSAPSSDLRLCFSGYRLRAGFPSPDNYPETIPCIALIAQ
jgi:hypothetical protein